MVSVPPSGMASRALTARFISTCSSWPRSALTCHRSASAWALQRMCSPSTRPIIRSKSRTTSPRSRILRSSICRRLNASSWRLSEAPCWAAFWMASRSSRVSLPGGRRRRCRISEKPRMAVRMLLKSWATPPASWPMLSIRCTCCSACSIRRRSVTSRPVSSTPPMSVRPARLVTPISSSRQSPLRGRTRSWCVCSGPLPAQRAAQEGLGRAGILGVDHVEAGAAEQLARQVVEQVADRRADVADDAARRRRP